MTGREVVVAGVGWHPYQRPSAAPYPVLGLTAARAALADAGVAWTAVQAACVGTAMLGMAAGWTMLRHLGATGIPVTQVENASATGSTAVAAGVTEVASGRSDLVLVVGVDKVDLPRLAPFKTGAQRLGPDGFLPAAGFALDALEHMAAYGTTREQLAAVAAKAHANAAQNPNAQRRKPRSADEILAATPVVDPFTAPMCTPLGEGAAALVLAAGDALGRLGIHRRRAVRVRASVTASEPLTDPTRSMQAQLTASTATAAYTQAGVGPSHLDVVEVHDAFAIEEILYAEALGLVDEGKGGPAVAAGATAIGSGCAVNPSGGLIAMGHPFGPTGVGQIGELTRQLRGEAGPRQQPNARIGLAQMVGIGEVCVIHILEKAAT
ncbi:thiolase family protein [Mycobacterium sp. ML4]